MDSFERDFLFVTRYLLGITKLHAECRDQITFNSNKIQSRKFNTPLYVLKQKDLALTLFYKPLLKCNYFTRRLRSK